MPVSTETKPESPKAIRRRRIVSGFAVSAFILLSLLIFIYAGKPMIEFLSEPERFRLWVGERGLAGKAAFIGMVVLQVIVAIIPGEAVELAAGYAFGTWEGLLLCLIGHTVGSLIVFLLVKYLGIKAVEAFFSREKIDSVRFLQNTGRLELILFIIFLIPGTPKDIITYFVGLTKIKLWVFLLIVFFARIPSVITSTISGDALGLKQYEIAGLTFGITLVLSLAGIFLYRKITKQQKK